MHDNCLPFFKIILIILLSLVGFSCTVTKPSYNSKENGSQDILYFDKIGLVKKQTVFRKIAPYVVTTAAAGFLFAGTGSLINEDTGEEYGTMYPILATATIGGLGGLMLTGLLPNKEKRKVITVDESNINTWWNAVQKADSRYKNYSITLHNNGKYLKNNVVVAVKNSNYRYLASRVIEEENAYDRRSYSSGSDGVTELIVTGAAIYVGYEFLKSIFGGGSRSSSSSNGNSLNETKHSWTCDSNGVMITIRQVGSTYYIGNERFTSWDEAKRRACIKTKCNNCN